MVSSSASHAGPVMIVDDDEDHCIEMAFFARQLGYEALCFASGEEMLGSMMVRQPQLIILDVNLPGRDGFRIADLARNIDHRVPICLLSGSGLRHLEALDRQLGMILSKPMNLTLLGHLLGVGGIVVTEEGNA
jgi:DNA-binding response OmpR family regulator